MKINNKIFIIGLICLISGFVQRSEASYSFRVIVKYPFASNYYYDSLGNVVSTDSLARFIPIKTIIFRTEAESLYQEGVTNDSGYIFFTFDKWQDESPVAPENILQMVIDFPNTDEVIRIDDKITFRHLKYSNVDFRGNPEEIEIILPMTVTKDEFKIGNPSWLNVCNFAVMNDMHIGHDYWDFGTSGWNDDTIIGQTNTYIQNNENIVAAINNLAPDFVVILGDVTESAEKSEFKCSRKVLGKLLQKPYIPVIGNHDAWPYYGWGNSGSEASIPSDCYIGEYFYDAYETMFDSVNLQFANWTKAPQFASSPDNYSYYLNSSFDYQNYKFVCVDFNSRNDAPYPWFGVNGEADVHVWSLDWINSMVDITTNEKRKIFVLGHHPLINRAQGPVWGCFSAHEIHQISDAGLKNNKPPAYWVGGHVHGDPAQRIDTTYYDGDTVAFVFTLNGWCAAGTYGYVRVYDKAKATIVHTPTSLPLPVTIKFMADYEFIDNAYAPYNYHWDFGDGYTYTTFYDYCYHTYHVANLYTDYKVTLTVRNLVWEYPNPPTFRLISIAKRIKVMASPYAVDTAFVHEDEVKLVWQFDVPGLIDGYKVRRGNTWYDINNPNQKWFIITGLSPGQWDNYAVFAKVNGQLSPEGPGTYINVQTKWVDEPTNLVVVGQPTPNQVIIQWTDNSGIEAGFKVARKVDDGAWNENYATVGPSQGTGGILRFTDDVEFLHKYTYKVRAYDNQGHYSA
jgi:hypothetical protein